LDAYFDYNSYGAIQNHWPIATSLPNRTNRSNRKRNAQRSQESQIV